MSSLELLILQPLKIWILHNYVFQSGNYLLIVMICSIKNQTVKIGQSIQNRKLVQKSMFWPFLRIISLPLHDYALKPGNSWLSYGKEQSLLSLPTISSIFKHSNSKKSRFSYFFRIIGLILDHFALRLGISWLLSDLEQLVLLEYAI